MKKKKLDFSEFTQDFSRKLNSKNYAFHAKSMLPKSVRFRCPPPSVVFFPFGEDFLPFLGSETLTKISQFG